MGPQEVGNRLAFGLQPIEPGLRVLRREARPQEAGAAIVAAVVVVIDAAMVDVVPAGPGAAVHLDVAQDLDVVDAAVYHGVEVALDARRHRRQGIVQILVGKS